MRGIARSGAERRVVVALMGVAVVVGLLLVVATSGPVRVWSEPPPGTVERFEPQVFDDQGGAVDEGEGIAPEREPGDSWFMRVVAVITGLLLLRLAWMVAVGWWAILRSWQRNKVRESVPSFDVLPTVAAAVTVDLDEDAQVAALRSGAPRNAIVACWTRLEDDVSAAGLEPLASETSAELTARVLGAALADPVAVAELAERYREARFSEHPIGESERDAALVALARIHASLRPAAALSLHGSARAPDPGTAPSIDPTAEGPR